MAKPYPDATSPAQSLMGAYASAQNQWTAGYGVQPQAWPPATQVQTQQWAPGYNQQVSCLFSMVLLKFLLKDTSNLIMNSRLQSFKKVFCKQYYSLPQESDLSNNFHVNRLHMAPIVATEAATLIPKLLHQLHKVQLMVVILLPILPRFPFNYVLNSCYIVACFFPSLLSNCFSLVIHMLFQSVILVLACTCFIVWAWKGSRSCLFLVPSKFK